MGEADRQDARHPADQPQIAEAAIQAVATGSTTKREGHIRRYDGAYRLVCLRAIPVRESARSIREVVVCGTDITRQELSGQMSDAQVQLAVISSGVGTWDWDLVTNQIMWTKHCKALLGVSPETPITYEGFLQIVHPDDRERVDQLIVRALAEHTDYQTEYHVIWPDGSMHWLGNRGRIICDVHDKPIHIIGAIIDMTGLKQAEESVTAILESITDSFWHVDTVWCVTYMNQKAEEFAGRSREKVLGQCLWDVVPDLLGTPFEYYYRAAMAMQQTIHFEALHPTYQRWVDVHVYPMQDGLSIYMQDITERKQAEEALQESEARFRRFMESNIIGMTMTDLEGNIHEANDTFLSLIGYTREELVAGRMSGRPSPHQKLRQKTHRR
ncbi:PAS domain S-box protein [Ktedonobacter racemifer]|uniref:PAS domain S-box protein n=1 Tax=Ktedonobacter racemifer TaxID=363277 RepID=UPI00058ED25D|nr:PAS domain S-box protein [Ktedonobacter racemifer]